MSASDDEGLGIDPKIWDELRNAWRDGTEQQFFDGLDVDVETLQRLSEFIPHVGSIPLQEKIVQQRSGFYQHYISYLAQDFGDPDEPEKGIEVAKLINDEIRATQRRMKLRNPPNDRAGYGLVIGRIQSGKTAHLLGLVSMALDPVETPAHYDTVIILSGLIDDLRKQTLGRFSSSFENYSGHAPLILPGEDCDLTDDDQETLDKITQHLGSTDCEKNLVLIIKKNHIVLQHLLSSIPNSPILRRRRVLIIDDEADHASIDTGQEEENDYSDTGEDIDEDPNATNRLLRQIIKRFNDSLACWYIGYTATPFANLLSHPESSDIEDQYGLSLYPRDMIQVLEKPPPHLDNEDYFLVPNSPHVLIRNRFVEGSPEETRRLKETILRHVLTEQIKILRGIEDHHTTLIHTSVSVEEHRRLTDCVLGFIEDLQDDDAVLDDLKKLAGEYPLDQGEVKKLHDRLKEIEEDRDIFLDILDRIETVEVNAREREEGDTHLRDLVYSKHKSNSYIAIGGTRLSRGLTLEGLTTTLFTRSARVPLYDTMLQMSRWCGYRSGYDDLVRITTTDDIRQRLVNIANEENDLRRKISLLPEDCNPADEIVWIREHPGMQVTRKEAMRNIVRRGWGGLQVTSFWSYASPAFAPDVESNTIGRLYNKANGLIEYTKALGKSVPTAEGTGAFDLSTGVPWKFIEQFLEFYLDSFTESQTSNTQNQLQQFLQSGGHKGVWNVGIHIPEKDKSVQISGLDIGIVNRSMDSKSEFMVVQSDGSNSTIDLEADQIHRTAPLLLIYLVDPRSTQGDRGIEPIFDEKVIHPVPAFGVCLPFDSTGDGGTEVSRPH